jgi:hypothetical protein
MLGLERCKIIPMLHKSVVKAWRDVRISPLLVGNRIENGLYGFVDVRRQFELLPLHSRVGTAAGVDVANRLGLGGSRRRFTRDGLGTIFNR